jgi:hypothetical protein
MATLSDLTPRVEEILRLAIVGRTNKAIVAEISVSHIKVEFHLARISKRSACARACWQAPGQGNTARIPGTSASEIGEVISPYLFIFDLASDLSKAETLGKPTNPYPMS